MNGFIRFAQFVEDTAAKAEIALESWWQEQTSPVYWLSKSTSESDGRCSIVLTYIEPNESGPELPVLIAV